MNKKVMFFIQWRLQGTKIFYHEQISHKKIFNGKFFPNYGTCVLLLACYTTRNMIHAYIVHMLHESILQYFSSDSHASVKFKLSCTVHGLSPSKLKTYSYAYALPYRYVLTNAVFCFAKLVIHLNM